MEDFITILKFWQGCFLALFDLDIPLSASLYVKWGVIVLGLMALPLFIRILFRLFGEGGNLAEDEQKLNRRNFRRP